MMNISQKQLLSVTSQIVRSFVHNVQSYSERNAPLPPIFYQHVHSVKSAYLNQLEGIKRLTSLGSKEWLICQSAIDSLHNQGGILIFDFDRVYMESLSKKPVDEFPIECNPASIKSNTAIPFELLSFNPEQEQEELGGSFEFDVLKAESIISYNSNQSDIKTNCPDCSASLVGGIDAFN